MKLLACHLREGVHSTGQKGTSRDLPVTLSFDGVHAAIELEQPDWYAHVDWTPEDADDGVVLQAAEDGLFVSDAAQKSVFVNLSHISTPALTDMLNRTRPLNARHFVLLDQPGAAVGTSTRAVANAQCVLRYIMGHVAPTYTVSVELRGSIQTTVLATFDKCPELLSHVRLYGSADAMVLSIRALFHWLRRHSEVTRLQCLLVDANTKHSGETDPARGASKVINRVIGQLRSELSDPVGFAPIKHSITIKNLRCPDEAHDTLTDVLLGLVAAMGPTDLILERCNISRWQANLLEERSANNHIFVHHNSAKHAGVYDRVSNAAHYQGFDDHARGSQTYATSAELPMVVLALKQLVRMHERRTDDEEKQQEKEKTDRRTPTTKKKERAVSRAAVAGAQSVAQATTSAVDEEQPQQREG